MLMFGIRMANTPLEIPTGWVENKLLSTNITDATHSDTTSYWIRHDRNSGLKVLTTIWKTLAELDTSTFILAWHPWVEHIVRSIKNAYFSKTLSKKVVNNKYTESLQMGLYTSITTICFHIGHNNPVDTILEDSNVIYTLD